MTEKAFHVFISYSSKDRNSVRSLAQRLRVADVRVWFDEWSLTPDRPYAAQIDSALKQSAALGVFIGPQKPSNPIEDEELINRALALQKRNPSFAVIPVLLPGANIDRIPAPLKDKQFADLR